jgi:UDP-N-acetylglucosamine 2-epimerase (non-hydrolysing)
MGRTYANLANRSSVPRRRRPICTPRGHSRASTPRLKPQNVEMNLLHVVGARPNFPKLAPVYRAGLRAGLSQVVLHTGQHYDDALSGAFFRDLGLNAPDLNLAVGSETQAVQTARIMERIEPVLIGQQPEWVVVYGDVNSTMAAALVASKLGIRVAHVEAGLRSFDRTMPEEINRIVTDRLSDLLLTPSRDADAQLRAEGEAEEKIAFVGNVMIDSLFHALPAARATGFREKIGVNGSAVVVTLHRPSNVDDPNRMRLLADVLNEIARERPVVFPAHPRTRLRLQATGLKMDRVLMLEPVGYLEMLDLIENAYAVVTDSGGLQEETTALGVPCLTVRPNTERPITITEGTNRLVPDPADIVTALREIVGGGVTTRPEGWDGHAGDRVIAAIVGHASTASRARHRQGTVESPQSWKHVQASSTAPLGVNGTTTSI